MGAVWLRFRAELRTRWRAWLGLALLVGLTAGAVLALFAGARRTDSAYDRFLRSQRAADAAIRIPPSDNSVLASLDPHDIAQLPEVVEAANVQLYASVRLPGGPGAVADASGRLGTSINRFKILEGRAADPRAPDEIVVGFDLAEKLGLRVGDRVTLATPLDAPDPSELDNPFGQAYAAVNRRILSALHHGKATVVGIEASPGEFPPFGGHTVPVIHLTRAFAREVSSPATALVIQHVVVVRLAHGTADVPAFQRGLEGLSGGKPIPLEYQHDQARQVQRSIHLQAVALRLLAVLTLVASILIFGQLLARTAILEAADYAVLAALGMTRRQRFQLGMARAVWMSGVAVVIGIGAAIAASPLLPWGVARPADPDPGIAIDWTVLLLGACVTVVLVVGLAARPVWRAARSAGVGAEDVTRARPSRLTSALGSARAPMPAVEGVRMALEPGRGRTAVPVRSTLACLILGVLTLAAAVTFGASLTHLLDTPRLYGVRWNAQVTTFERGVVDLARDAPPILRDLGVEGAASGYNELPLQSGRVRFVAFALDPIFGDTRPPVVEGRYPSRPREIALGSATLDELGAHLGDRVDIRLSAGRPSSLRIVGRAVVPPIATASRFGEGALLTLDGARRLYAAVDEGDAPSLYLDLPPGLHRHEVVAALQRGLDLDASLLTSNSVRGRPTDVVNFGRVEQMPLVLAAILGALAAATLAHVLVSAGRRHRRDLAVLKTLGFVRRQIALAVTWQAGVLTLVALVVGLPVGIAAGRWLWTRMAHDLGVEAIPVVPLVTLALMVPAAFVLATLIAVAPAWIAARTRPAVALRAE